MLRPTGRDRNWSPLRSRRRHQLVDAAVAAAPKLLLPQLLEPFQPLLPRVEVLEVNRVKIRGR